MQSPRVLIRSVPPLPGGDGGHGVRLPLLVGLEAERPSDIITNHTPSLGNSVSRVRDDDGTVSPLDSTSSGRSVEGGA